MIFLCVCVCVFFFSVNTLTCGDILMSTLNIFLSNGSFILNVAVSPRIWHSGKIKRSVIAYLLCLFSLRSKPEGGVAFKTQLECCDSHFLRVLSFFLSFVVGWFLYRQEQHISLGKQSIRIQKTKKSPLNNRSAF